MKVVLWVVLTISFASCSDSKEELNESELNKGKRALNVKELALSNRIDGKWRQINRKCDAKGRNCVPLANPIEWTFKENDVVWGRFTHPYNISNDTIYIAGIPYRIALNSEDTLLFHATTTNEFMQLVRN